MDNYGDFVGKSVRSMGRFISDKGGSIRISHGFKGGLEYQSFAVPESLETGIGYLVTADTSNGAGTGVVKSVEKIRVPKNIMRDVKERFDNSNCAEGEKKALDNF